MKIRFIDPRNTPRYDLRSIGERPLGGSDSTLIRVAETLARQGHEVHVVQREREAWVSDNGVRYDDESPATAPDAIVVMRKIRALTELRQRFPSVPLFVWLHNFQRRATVRYRPYLTAARATLVCVSQAHARDTDHRYNGGFGGFLRVLQLGRKVPVRFVHNPIDDDLVPDGTPVDRDKLVFFSSPRKGLALVLTRFQALRRRHPELKLYVADPGYTGGMSVEMARDLEGVRAVGALRQEEVLAHVRSAFCVFYPQAVYPETFGLVFAEANAVGTPVLAHDFGSAREVLSSEEQLVDADDPAAVQAKFERWRQPGMRPQVSARPELRASYVAQQWVRLLEATAQGRAQARDTLKLERSTHPGAPGPAG